MLTPCRFRNLLFILFIFRYSRLAVLYVYGYGPLTSINNLRKNIYRNLYKTFLRLPGIRTKVQADIDVAIAGLEKKLVPSGPGITSFTSLPAAGWAPDQVRAELIRLGEMKHTSWENGRVSGAVYHGGKELCDLQTEAFGRFGVANPIHPDVFPGVRNMEAEVVAMVLGLFNAPEGAAGVTTSGGSESIIMAVLSAREKAKAERGVAEPEMYVFVLLAVSGAMTDMYTLGSYRRRLTRHSAKQQNTSRSASTSFHAQHRHTKSPSLVSHALSTATPFSWWAPLLTSLTAL